MKNQLSLLLVALSIFSLNSLPTHAASKTAQVTKKAKTSLAANPGSWCFELAWMGSFCFNQKGNRV